MADYIASGDIAVPEVEVSGEMAPGARQFGGTIVLDEVEVSGTALIANAILDQDIVFDEVEVSGSAYGNVFPASGDVEVLSDGVEVASMAGLFESFEFGGDIEAPEVEVSGSAAYTHVSTGSGDLVVGDGVIVSGEATPDIDREASGVVLVEQIEVDGVASFIETQEIDTDLEMPEVEVSGSATFTPPPEFTTDDDIVVSENVEVSGAALFRAFSFATFGRRRIAVDQQPGGVTYPFNAVDDTTILDVIADAYVAYRDDDCQFVRPFQIAWLSGFGTEAAENPEGYPTPSHAADVLITDSEGATVFDSTIDSTYSVSNWGVRFRVHQWVGDTVIVRLVEFNSYGEEDTPIEFPIYIVPSEGGFWLHERALEQLPLKLWGISVDGTTFSATEVELVSGYNMAIRQATVGSLFGSVVDPNGLVFDAAPGSGPLGRYPGCEEEGRVVRTINNVPPVGANGNFILDADGCYTITPNAAVVDEADGADPRTVALSTGAIITGICGPCCSCDDYVVVYKALSLLNDRVNQVKEILLEAKSTYQENLDRWAAQKECRDNAALKLQLLAVCGCRVTFGFQYCNPEVSCLSAPPLNVHVSFEVTGTQPDGFTVIGVPEGTVFIQESSDQGFVNGTIEGSWPDYTLSFAESVSKGTSIRGRFDVVFQRCGEATGLTATATVTRLTDLAEQSISIERMIPRC